MKKTLLLIMLLALGSIYAQDPNSKTELKFTKQEMFNDYKIVYFVLDKDIDYNSYKEIMLDMKENLNIMENILVYLKKYGYDYSYKAVVSKQINTNTSKNNNINNKYIPAHYPERKKADGEEVDDASYNKAIEFWKKQYPKEWEKYKLDNNIK